MSGESELIGRRYRELVDGWRRLGIRSRDQLAAALQEYRTYFAYNSGRIENPNVTYHDTREVFENGRAVGYTGDVRTLFEIQNQKELRKLLEQSAERAIRYNEEQHRQQEQQHQQQQKGAL